jgi:radical SAM superfamily enzyme YgiQ (UPF0313 family)
LKILLIDPGGLGYSTGIGMPFWYPRLGLPMVAAHTPLDVDIRIIDNELEEIDYDTDADLVGITALTQYAPKAYEISTRFRDQGVKTVLGGIHVTALPEEGLRFADAIVIGEAEEIWSEVVEDAGKGRLRRTYRASDLPKMADLRAPRLDLFRHRDLYTTLNLVQTTRGCPYGCEFCAVGEFYSRRFRHRPVENIVRELENRPQKDKPVVFLDAELIGSREFAKDLFKRLKPLEIQWVGPGNFNIADDPELLALAAESGCAMLYMGFETVYEANLTSVSKYEETRMAEWGEKIKRIFDAGIFLCSTFIFGFDNDDEGVFERTVEFVTRHNLLPTVFHVLTPYPGTPLYARLEREGRIIDRDWSKYDQGSVVIRPKKMTPEALEGGLAWAFRQIPDLGACLKDLGMEWTLSSPRIGDSHRSPKDQ